MIKPISTAVTLVLLLSACSTPIERRQISGSDEYTNADIGEPLKIPSHLKEPTYSKEFDVPELTEEGQARSMGRALDIRPPLQILASADGTFVEEGTDNVKVMIEAVGDQDLNTEVHDSIIGYLAQREVGVTTDDFDGGVIETDWIETRQEFKKNWIGKNDEYVLRQRYRFTIQVKPHGRSGDVSIDLIEHDESIDGATEIPALTSDDKRRYTIDMLNDAVAYVSAKRAAEERAERIRNSLGIEIELEDNAEQETVWVAESKFLRTWDRLGLVLPELGFDIEDRDRNNGIYYARLDDDPGFWDSMFGGEALPLDEGLYRFKLTDTEDGKTQIQMFDAEDNKLSNEVVEQIHEFFAEVMGEDRSTSRRR
ncbi:outer membrane protein assembly factor BamC [Paraferrimonas sedimenticola]|uniref:Outer membrane protein assembly factor BamC n=1 Tax=Paraferrimonas sedimenticola TaxID=375674 RepID=A0AA37RSY9_9GAMM|nr:outer membrane protein assembly factor BamC [Paraferrimonas sedimenticola]GLP94761.1 outer membrane protein assembly factor BamC [Paraferrimonas sedimenticola]